MESGDSYQSFDSQVPKEVFNLAVTHGRSESPQGSSLTVTVRQLALRPLLALLPVLLLCIGPALVACSVAIHAVPGVGTTSFDFTRVCMNGSLSCEGNANTEANPSATDWACTKDNVTNLYWSLQTQPSHWFAANATTYPNAGHNSAARCGFDSDWRLPTRSELLSIVHHGLPPYPLFGGPMRPMIDVNYFPGTQMSAYWTSETFEQNPGMAWFVAFSYGHSDVEGKTVTRYVRLVRSGK